MPNHCDSDLTVTGPQEQVGEFLARYVTAADGSLLDLNAIRPYPQRFEELDRVAHEWEEQHPENPYKGRPKDGFNQGGYEWRCDNWGTKWGCYATYGCDTPIEKLPDGVVLHFSTAWSPFRTDLLIEMSRQVPGVRFQYDSYEQGAAFQQHTTVMNGEVLADCTDEYAGERGG